nr:hypothetical protein [Tanacetum cinerariifolium]
TGTLSSLQHLAKDLSFGDLFFNDKPSEADNEKTTMETEAELMVSVTIQQDTSVIPPITTPIIDLTSRPNSLNVHWPLQATETKTITTTTTIHPPLPQPQQSTTDSMLMKRIGELEHIMANLIQDNKHLEERLDSHGAHLYILENLDIPQPATPEPAWFIPSSNVPVLKNNWASTLASTYSPSPEDSLLAQTGDMAMFMDWFCKRQEITKLKPQDLKGPTFELVKVFHPIVIHLHKPLPLGGPPGKVTIQSDFFFNKDLEYLRYDSNARCGLKRSASMILLLCMVFLTDGSKDNDSTLTDIFEGDRRAVRTHMRILSVVRIEVFSMYGYDYMKNIVLRRADLNEHIIAKRDFKYLYPSDFKDLQRVEDFQLGIESYQTQLNLTNLNGMQQALNTSMTTW